MRNVKQGEVVLIVDGSYYYKRPRLGLGIEIITDKKHAKYAASWDDETSSNIKAEYQALIQGLVLVLGTCNERKIRIYMDCEPVMNQVLGIYSTADHLVPYRNRCFKLLKPFDYRMNHIPREENTEADKLSKLCK